jgi:methionyl-tRNA formyltransferase
MNSGDSYIVLGCKSWNRQVFDEVISRWPGRWTFIGEREWLTVEAVAALRPRMLFFLHWSWKVPEALVANYECVCFHMTEVPYGRGGSPLQNLIVRGHRQTKLTALRMTSEFDAGPVYLREDLSLEGSAEEIYRRATRLSAQCIRRIIDERPSPVPQSGPATVFARRRPEESEIPALDGAEPLYDFIRMLDAEGYPRAFLERGGFRFEFDRAQLDQDGLTARVLIKPIQK